METFGKKLTRTEAVTAASVQGATIEGRVAIHDLDNPHMQNKSVFRDGYGESRPLPESLFSRKGCKEHNNYLKHNDA